MSDRRYTHDEIQAIFRRATERQQAAAPTEERTDGLTLAELEAIGVETGLDPAHVAAAAREVGHLRDAPAARSLAERFHGLPAAVDAARVVPGTMDDVAWAETIKMLQTTFGTKGAAEQVGPLRTWRAFAPEDAAPGGAAPDAHNPRTGRARCPVHIDVQPDDQGTRLTAYGRVPSMRMWEGPSVVAIFAALTLAVVLVMVLGGSGLPGPVPFAMGPLFFLTLGGSLGAYYRAAHRSEIETTRAHLATAFDRIERLLAARAGAAPGTPAAHAAPLAGDLDARPEAAEGPGATRRTRA